MAIAIAARDWLVIRTEPKSRTVGVSTTTRTVRAPTMYW